MPFAYRRGFMRIGREGATPGTLSTTALPGLATGPASVLTAVTNGPPWAALSPGLILPSTSREFEPTVNKHQSPAQLGRRYLDLAVVAARRELQGQFAVEVMPDTFGQLLYLLFGTDVVVATQSNTVGAAGIAANATSLPLTSPTSAAITVGQRIWLSGGGNAEYVNVATAAGSGVSTITITGGAGTGGGVKNAYTSGQTVQIGPWTHTFSPTNSATGVPTCTIEDSWGGITNSQIYTACTLSSMEFSAPIENDTESLVATFKVVGQAAATPAGATGSGGGTLPAEELPCAAGNAATFTAGGATLPSAPFNNIYVPDLKMTIDNVAKLVKASAGSPDPYTTLSTGFSCRGNFDTVFESYGTFQDYYANTIWNPATFTWTWGTKCLQGAAGPVSPTLTITIQRLALIKANKPTMKEDIVHFPVENFTGQDFPDFGGTNGPILTMALTNNVAQY